MTKTSKNDILTHLKLLLLEESKDEKNFKIAELFPSIIYVFDAAKKKLKYLNGERLGDALGYSAADIEDWEDDMINLVFKDDFDMVQKELEKYHALSDEDDYSFNCRLNHKEGDWRYFRTRGTVLRRNEDGKAASLLLIAEDVTEKTQFQEEVIALKNLIDDTEDLIQFGSWSWNVKVDKIYWTDGMYKLLGYNKEDVESKVSNRFYFKHVVKSDARPLQRIINQAIVNKTHFEYQYRIKTSNYEEKVVSTKGKTITDAEGEVIKVIGITRDITTQTRINKDLIHYQEMILEKEEFLNQGSWETNVQNGYTIWSKGMYRLFGYDPEKDRGSLAITKDLHFSHMSEEEVLRSKQDWEKVLKEKDNYTRKATITTKEGLTRQLETYGKIIRDKDGNALKVIGTTRDVTQLGKYERSLENKINELNRSNTELEEFAYVASHDLQEPLRKLTTFSERLQAKYKKELAGEGIMYLDRIVAATDNMRLLIENLLELSRISRSGKIFKKENLTRLLEEAKSDLELKIEESGSIIHAPALPEMEVIPSQIKQLFNNLLANSIKFKKPDQPAVINICCTVLPNHEKLRLNLRSDKNYYKITVEDNGIGFEEQYAERIFQIFQRLHGKAEYPGSGIGLAICKKIVENHNGIIYANGYPGKRTIFNVVLPETQL